MRRQHILRGGLVPRQGRCWEHHARTKQRSLSINRLAVVLVLVLATCLFTSMASAQALAMQVSDIHFAPSRIETAFPTGIRFLSTVQSDTAPIVTASLLYRVGSEPITTRASLTIQPGNQVALSYYLDTTAGAIPPGAVISCRWEVVDASGNRKTSEETSALYEDGRFLWQQRVNERATILWHDAPAELGEMALVITEQSLEYEHRIFQTDLARPVRIILYNTLEEFSAWQASTPRFIAGRAFPALGITVQAIGEFDPQDEPEAESKDEWLQRVIPHELSRLYFYQATNGSTDAPRWLDEGLALYNEFAGHAEEERLLQSSILRRRLLSFTALNAAFDSTDEEQVRLAQAQAYSAVKYFMYWYGPERLVGLLEAYRNGMANTEAFSRVLKRTPEEFVEDWQIWLGVPWEWRQTPAPLPTATASRLPTPAGTSTPTPPGPTIENTSDDVSPSANQPASAPPVSLLLAVLTLALAVPAVTTASALGNRPRKPRP